MSRPVEAAPPRRTCFANSTMIMFDGGARAFVGERDPCRSRHMGQVLVLRPMEECLLSGFPCALLCAAIRHSRAILCGHSLGVTVALTVATRLTTCGLCVRGVVGLDPRLGQALDLWGRLEPESLLGFQAPLHFRLETVSTVDYVAPPVPRGRLPSRFPKLAEVAAWHHCQAAWRRNQLLADADHYDVRRAHIWDISRCIEGE